MTINKKIFLTNIIISASIALFIYFLQASLLLKRLMGGAYDLIAYVYRMVSATPRAPSLVNTLSDTGVVLVTALVWSCFRTTRAKIIANAIVMVLLLPLSLIVFRQTGTVLTSPLIALGVIAFIAADSLVTHISLRLRHQRFDDRQEAEFSIVRHINHSVKPNIQIAKSPIAAVRDYLDDNRLAGCELAKRLDGSTETVGEALQNAITALEQINDILDNTRKLVTQQIRKEDFRDCSIVAILQSEIVPLYRNEFSFCVDGDVNITARLHRGSFLEAINNMIRNASMHAFPPACKEAVISFAVRETRRKVIIDYSNNGKPFPAGMSANEFLSFGRKSNDSPGEGLGGAWIGKMVAAHNGEFEIVRDGQPLHFRIILPKGGL